jgi:hypothetical protein
LLFRGISRRGIAFLSEVILSYLQLLEYSNNHIIRTEISLAQKPNIVHEMAAQTATTKYILADNGVKFAYRILGASSSALPLFMHGHFRSNMDFWDPDLLNSLAAKRPVIIFDQAGVGRSSGEVATTFSEWADNVIALLKALNIEKIDLLGFSMGGCAAQM